MRFMFTCAAALFASAYSQQFISDVEERTVLSSSVERTGFGAELIETVYEDVTEKILNFPFETYERDYEQQAAFIERARLQHLAMMKQREQANANNGADYDHAPVYTCDNRAPNQGDTAFAMFLPVLAGNPTLHNPVATFEGKCFKNITMELEAHSSKKYFLHLDFQEPESFWCREAILFANTEILHIDLFFRHGKHKLAFNLPDENTQVDVAFGGIKAFLFCEGIVHEVESVLRTLTAFIGGISRHTHLPIIGSHVPKYMEQANVNFLRDAMGYQLEERETKKVEIDESLIQSGDFLAILRLDGLDPIIMYGSGSHIGHSVMALRFWDDEELYIVESQDGWYWPNHGLQRTKFSQWMKWAEDASFNVAHLPLKPELRAKFNETAAQEWFLKTEGLPYGYHNFLFGWIDTPRDNLPPLLANEFAPVLFSMLEHVIPNTVDIFFNQALNKRLGTEGLDLAGIAAEAARQNMSVQDVMAMVEQDGWEYTGEKPDGISYVCSAYVAAMYKVAGLFDDMEINATEFAPKDVYTLNFFDLDFERPQQCIDADPDLPYCQLLGNYRLVLDGYSTVEPYSHMAESCPTINPDYFRPDGC